MISRPSLLPRILRSGPAGGPALLVLLLGQIPVHAGAADAVPPPGVAMSTMVQTFVTLALILAVFVGAAWLLRRLNGTAGQASGRGPMHIVGTLALGPRERIIVVEIENTWLLVGITPGQMRTLHTMPKGTLPVTGSGGEKQFAHWLRQFRESSKDVRE